MYRFSTSFVRIVSLVLFLQCTSAASAATVHVTATGDDTADGATWTTAKQTVTAGLAAATSGDEVWVAGGTYTERITLKNGVALFGGFVGTETDRNQRDWATNETAIESDEPGHVVTAPPGVAAPACIDGFVIRNGPLGSGTGVFCHDASPNISNNTITGNRATGDDGGGIYCDGGSPVLENNTITNNVATRRGGGIALLNTVNALLVDNTVADNTIEHWNASAGGLLISAASVELVDNNFEGNDASYGGAISCENGAALIARENTFFQNTAGYGGAIRSQGCAIMLLNNSFLLNTADSYGGAVAASGVDLPTTGEITRNVFRGNRAERGGAVSLLSHPGLTVVNNEFVGNVAEEEGGGIYIFAVLPGRGPVTLSNNTIVGNVATDGGGLYATSALYNTANNLIAFNSSGIYDRRRFTMFANNCVYGNHEYDLRYPSSPIGVNGNISADPLLRNVGPGPDGEWATEDDILEDLRHSAGSPCIDAGSNGLVPADTSDLDNDGDTTEPLPFDLHGAARFVDTPAAPDVGNGTPPIVDIGAYEFAPGNGDFDNNGDVDLADFPLFADCLTGPGAGLAAPECRTADFNGDGNIDLKDAAAFTAVFAGL